MRWAVTAQHFAELRLVKKLLQRALHWRIKEVLLTAQPTSALALSRRTALCSVCECIVYTLHLLNRFRATRGACKTGIATAAQQHAVRIDVCKL